MISTRNSERLGDLLAMIVAILLAGVIVVLAWPAEKPSRGTATLPGPVKID